MAVMKNYKLMSLFLIFSYTHTAILSQDTLKVRGLLFYSPFLSTPLEGVFVKKDFDTTQTIIENCKRVSYETDTGIIIPLFFTSFNNSNAPEKFSKGVSIQNEDKKFMEQYHSQYIKEGITKDTYSLKVLYVELHILESGFQHGFAENKWFAFSLILNNRQLLKNSTLKPQSWGPVVDFRILNLEP